MRLVEIQLALDERPLPPRVAALLDHAKNRVDELEDKSRAAIPAFVPSDFALVFRALAEIQSANLATGRRFLEWGSGMGVVACLAAELGFEAAGLEIEPSLVHIADEIARLHGFEVQFICGSFVPAALVDRVEVTGDVHWLTTTDADDGYRELQLEPDDFDVIFAYPWPGEEQVLFDIFTNCASVGALLLTYHGQEGMRLQRKLRR